MKTLLSTACRMMPATMAYLATGRWYFHAEHCPSRSAVVPDDLFGVCVAGSEDRRIDDYIVERLQESGVVHVRVDYAYSSPGAYGERLVRRLLHSGFRVCLHLVQPAAEAAHMSAQSCQDQWRRFLNDVFAGFGSAIDCYEIGSTCNRRRFSGYTVDTLLAAWRIAHEENARYSLKLAGPNVTDFEPVYNLYLLHVMRKRGLAPHIHTDNLFVERAGEPEAFDHKILGRHLAGLLKYNVVKKACLLADIGHWAGVDRTMCTQVSWSLRRIARLHDNVESKQADYLVRYGCLAAASGALSRIYWGPLIGQREGLIDDGTDFFPDVPHVAFYGKANGQIEGYRVRPAFHAFQTMNRMLRNTVFKRAVSFGDGLFMLEFESERELRHVVWTRDGTRSITTECYEQTALMSASLTSREGLRLKQAPVAFSESPLYLCWPKGSSFAVKSRLGTVADTRFANIQDRAYIHVNNDAWRGVCLCQYQGVHVSPWDLLNTVLQGQYTAVLRNSRNKVVTLPAPWTPDLQLVIKQFKPRSLYRRLIQPNHPGKALRSWNNTNELIRRGIGTHIPIGYFQAVKGEGLFICEQVSNAWSVRQAFSEFARNAREFHGLSSETLYQSIAEFLVRMHNRGVFFRDLSAGNLLFRYKTGGKIHLFLIDTDRARFYPGALRLTQRLADLIRVCHPLNWSNRNRFLWHYFNLWQKPFRFWMKACFVYYDGKHLVKKLIKSVF